MGGGGRGECGIDVDFVHIHVFTENLESETFSVFGSPGRHHKKKSKKNLKYNLMHLF